jgi:hypothetical protein
MSYRLRQMDVDDKVCEQMDVRLLEQVYPKAVMERCVEQSQRWVSKERRVRQSTVFALVWLLIGMGLWSRLNQRLVWQKLTGMLRDLHPGKPEDPLSASAVSGRRKELGSDGLQGLMKTCCRPIATRQQMPSAFFGRYHLQAIDGTLFNTAETPANEAAFGRSRNQYGKGAYAQVRCVLRVECGSHAVIGMQIAGYRVSEVHGAHQLLDQVGPNTLVLVDAGILSGGFCEHVRDRHAHVLAALEAGTWEQLPGQRRLSDGSVLAWVPASRRVQYPMREGMWVRIISYRLTDERLGEVGKVYRLVTTLLNPRVAPALALVGLYHERWEIELVIDEVKTHERGQRKVLRSKTPEGVIQELYGIFLAHYAVRVMMARAATQADLDPDRLSFTDGIFHLCEMMSLTLILDPERAEWGRTCLYRRMRQTLLPERQLRINRREVKQVYNKYKPKKRDVPAPKPFEPHEQFLDFVDLLDPLDPAVIAEKAA